MSSYAIEIENLKRVYRLNNRKGDSKQRELVALNGIDLQVHRSELFGVLGANGAGKTTLIKILTTLLAPTSGRALVDGLDVTRDAQAVRERISVASGGEASGYGLLTVRDNLWMFGQFYGMSSRETHRRIDELLEMIGMSDRADSKINELSTGMRQKVNYIRGFLSDPHILFLDEPTLGLDVQVARVLRDYTRQWVTQRTDKTVLLTTHYMAEADELCDRVAIIAKGRIIACDTPANLKRSLQQGPTFSLQVTNNLTSEQTRCLNALPGVNEVKIQSVNGTIDALIRLDTNAVLPQVLSYLNSANVDLLALEKREPSLEEVFVTIVEDQALEQATQEVV